MRNSCVLKKVAGKKNLYTNGKYLRTLQCVVILKISFHFGGIIMKYV